MTEIIKELTTIKKTNEIISDQVLNWVNIAEVQKVQKAILYKLKKQQNLI